ncbi:hypothetical protein HK096_004971 [Nowakowskiella sp. JEL0078]|nr:hypothetical protein HK096_004971 [Nowakowskiella sp. JEL0078]
MLSSSILASIALNGTAFGSLLFVGAVDVRLFLSLIKTPNGAETIKTVFPLWWPYGRDLMAPCGFLGIIVNSLAYYQSSNAVWLVPATTHLITILWTVSVMGEDIKKLVAAKGAGLERITRSFCWAHFPRILFAGIGYGVSLASLHQ